MKQASSLLLMFLEKISKKSLEYVENIELSQNYNENYLF